MNKNNFFEHFRRNPSISPDKGAANGASQIYLQLNFDDFGAYLSIVDKRGKPTETSHHAFTGPLRSLIRSIESITDQDAFQIDWANEGGNLYLNQHEHLIWQLKSCPEVLVDQSMEPIRFDDGLAEIHIDIDEASTKENPMMEAKLVAQTPDASFPNFEMLSESFLYADGQIVETKPVGASFQQLSYFATVVAPADLQKYLSLLFTHLEHIKVKLKGFNFEYRDDRIEPVSSLLIERIDETNMLFLRIGQTWQNLDIDFFHEFDLKYVVELNEFDKKALVRYVDTQNPEQCIADIFEHLKKNLPAKERKDLAKIRIEDSLLALPEEIAKTFIADVLPKLLESYKLFGSEKLKSYNIRAVVPKLETSFNSGIDFLEGDVHLDFEGERINLFAALKQFNKQKYVMLNDGTKALVNEVYMKKLERIFRKNKDKVRLSFFDMPLIEELLDEQLEQTAFKKSREFFEGFNKLQTAKPKMPTMNAKLRSYQKEGYKWLNHLHKSGLNGCLADDMGLGKTLQTITLLSAVYPKATKPSIIVMPKSLLFNWQSELDKFNPKITYAVHYGTGRNLEENLKANILLTTYATMRNDIEQLKEIPFLYTILDESQHIKNINSQVTKAAFLLQSEHRLALSGTPVENNLGELYSLFRFLNPAMFGSPELFNSHYGSPIQKDNDEEAAHELKRKIYPFILRRLKKDVLKDLPDKIEQVHYVEMTAPQKRLYHERRMFYQEAIKQQIGANGIEKSQFFIFQALTELRQLAGIPEAKTNGTITSPKIEHLIEQVTDATLNGHKVLVFTNFLAALEHVGAELEKSGIGFVSMSGATRDRQSLVRRFQEEDECKVFLMTLKTGGTGLNLTAADTVFIFDPWWNAAAESQAIDRTHRIGQTNKVNCYRLIAKDSIEEKILLLQEQKRQLFDSIISADSSSMKSFSHEDIDFMLGQ